MDLFEEAQIASDSRNKTIKTKEISEFENRMARAKGSDFFRVAKSNAENRLFEQLKMSSEEITNYFQVQHDSDTGNGVAKKGEHSWMLKLDKMSDIIPLDDYVVPPTRIENGVSTPMQFRVSHFLRDTNFIKRCKQFYSKYNMDFKVIKLKTENLWKIVIVVTDPNGIVIKAE